MAFTGATEGCALRTPPDVQRPGSPGADSKQPFGSSSENASSHNNTLQGDSARLSAGVRALPGPTPRIAYAALLATLHP